MTDQGRPFNRAARLRKCVLRETGERNRILELISVHQKLRFQKEENTRLGLELRSIRKKLLVQDAEQVQSASELLVARKEIGVQKQDKVRRAFEFFSVYSEMAVQREKRAAELVVANKELRFQGEEKAKRSSELAIANLELGLQGEEKAKRAAELLFANKELQFQREKSRLQAQLQQSQKLESLGTLAGGVAHDMNNVLSAILGLSSTLLEGQQPGTPAHRAFETISKAALRGGKLVKSLLTFARQSPAENLQVDLNTILRDELRLLECTALAKVRLDVDLAADLRPIRGDAGALTHAFMNLCINAVDAMPENGILTLRSRNLDGDWVEVLVADTGTGMSREVQERALDPFFTTKEVGKGTGLGLSTVYATVKAHHGQLEIESEPGQGTRVSLRFRASEPEPVTLEPERERGPAPAQRALTVLVVDDDELIQSSMQAILDLLGHAVITARSGEEALAKLEARFEPDLVILDMNMPGLGGGGTLPRLRALRPSVPVLLATGRSDQTSLDLIEGHANVTLLPKPFSITELKQYLSTLRGD